MKPVFDTKTGSIYTRTVRSFSMVMIFTMLAAVAIVSLTSSSAWSFEAYYGRLNDNGAVETTKTTLASHHPSKLKQLKTSSILADSHTTSAADTCLPLLTSIRQTSPQYAMDRSQRSAGKVATVGLIFGVRFALTPPKKAHKPTQTQASFDVWQPEPSVQVGNGDRSALAVASYRQCQKQQALKALSDFRWAR